MKRKQYSVEQIVVALKQAELSMPVADLVRQLGISEQTYYRWKKQYAGLESNQVRELKQLQDENERLKKLVAELSLDKAILREHINRFGDSLLDLLRSVPPLDPTIASPIFRVWVIVIVLCRA
jgi:putative transposase